MIRCLNQLNFYWDLFSLILSLTSESDGLIYELENSQQKIELDSKKQNIKFQMRRKHFIFDLLCRKMETGEGVKK